MKKKKTIPYYTNEMINEADDTGKLPTILPDAYDEPLPYMKTEGHIRKKSADENES